MDVKKFIKRLKESQSYKKFKEDIDEISVTGNVAGYQTPKAFASSEKSFDKKAKEDADQLGFEVVPQKKNESLYKEAMKALHEASYKEYKGDKTRSVNEKINYSIKELNQALMQVERAVSHATRLKTEMAVDQRSLWRTSHNRLTKIGERLNRIGKKIHELGA